MRSIGTSLELHGGPCDYYDSLSPKNRIWDFGLKFWTLTSDSGLQASDFGLRLVNYTLANSRPGRINCPPAPVCPLNLGLLATEDAGGSVGK